MAEILYTRGPITAAGQLDTPMFNVLLDLDPEEQAALGRLCPAENPVKLDVLFTTVDFEAREVLYAGGQLGITYIGGRDSRPEDVSARCKQIVEEKLRQAAG